MTQEPAEQQRHNPQKYEKFESVRVDSYEKAKIVATAQFETLTRQSMIGTYDHPEFRVRIRRRRDRSREYFDVVSYRRLKAETGQPKAS